MSGLRKPMRLAATGAIIGIFALSACDNTETAEPLGGEVTYPTGIDYSDDTRRVIESVNRFINTSIKHGFDRDLYNKPEWAVDARVKGSGDCEDFVLTKLSILRSLGLCAPGNCKMLMVEHDNLGEENYHAVLAIATTRKIIILDNRYLDIYSWQRSGYRLMYGEIEFRTPDRLSVVDDNPWGLRGES